MADDENKPQDIPTNFLLMKTRSRVPWAVILILAVMAGIAGGVLWYMVSSGS